MLWLFLAVFFIAAASNASPCKVSSGSSASGSGGPAASSASSSAGVVPTGKSPGSKELAAPGSAGTQLTTGPSGQADLAKPLAAAPEAVSNATATPGSCPPGFINTVFNTNAPDQVGWPSTVWGSLTSHGITDWIGFSINTLNTKQDYDVNGAPAPTTPSLNNAQIHLVMDPTDVSAAVQLVQGPSPPAYLGLFNEPDYSFEGLTRLTSPQDAATSLAQMFSMPRPNTKYIAPAVAFPNSNWLPSFKASCNGCFSQISIVPMHIYNPDPASVISEIQQFHATWPDQVIWITELSPARDDCKLTAATSGPGSIGGYIKTLIPEIAALGYVEKVFWNSGEWDSSAINHAPAACNPSLTDASGNPTPVLQVLGQVCGGSGSTATSKVKRSAEDKATIQVKKNKRMQKMGLH